MAMRALEEPNGLLCGTVVSRAPKMWRFEQDWRGRRGDAVVVHVKKNKNRVGDVNIAKK